MPLGSKQFVQMPLVTSALSGMPLVQVPFDLLSVCLPCQPSCLVLCQLLLLALVVVDFLQINMPRAISFT